MPVLDPPPTLRHRERERRAFACRDASGSLHYVRVLESSILGRPGERDWNSCGPRLETPDGAPVVHVQGDSYLLWSKAVLEWIEVEALGTEGQR